MDICLVNTGKKDTWNKLSVIFYIMFSIINFNLNINGLNLPNVIGLKHKRCKNKWQLNKINKEIILNFWY